MVEVNWDAIIALAIPNLIGLAAGIPCIGQISNKDGTAWWQVIKKPSWVIAGWFFGPVIALILTSLGYSSYLVYNALEKYQDRSELLPAVLYAAVHIEILIGCTALYKFHNYSFTFGNILVTDTIVLALTTVFYQIAPVAVLFMIPLHCWQVYITFLSHALWVLNTPKAVDYDNLKV